MVNKEDFADISVSISRAHAQCRTTAITMYNLQQLSEQRRFVLLPVTYLYTRSCTEYPKDPISSLQIWESRGNFLKTL